MTYDNRRDCQIKISNQSNPQYFDMTKINQKIIILLDNVKPNNMQKKIPLIKKHLKMVQFYNKNFT